MRHAIWATLVVILIGALMSPAVALAGGWSTVSADPWPPQIEADRDIKIGFTVLQHGVSPLTGLQAGVTAVHESGERVTAYARSDGPAGHYSTTIRFSRPGAWSWSVDVFEGPHLMPPVMVVAPGAVPAGEAARPAGSTSAASLDASSFAPADAGMGLVSAIAVAGWAAALVLGVLAFRRGSAPGRAASPVAPAGVVVRPENS
jgi:hypothetical protein